MRLTKSYIAITFLSILFIACHPDSQPAAARTNNNSKFHDPPVKSPPVSLLYDTSSAASRVIMMQLDNYYQKQVREGFNGSVLVGYKGKIIYERYFGFGTRKITPLSPNSPSQLASVSKTFTGAAILYLYEHKYLNIDDPVQHYIREFPYPNITVRMLLSHRSGLPDYTKWVPVYNKDRETPI